MSHPRFFRLLLGAWLLLPLPAAGQEPTATHPAKAKEIARTRFQEGVKAYEERRYKDAVDLLLEADRAMHSPAFAYNIGLAFDAMGDTASALRWLRMYLREVPGAEDRPTVEQRISALETILQQRGVQQATILSTPESATVAVDGRPVGVTPWTGELLPGRHQVRLELPGHSPTERYFEVRAHRAEDFSFALPPVVRRDPTPSPAPAPPPADAGRRSPGVSPWTWAAFGAGGLALGGAVAFELARASAEDEAAKASQVEYREKLDAAKGHQTTARILAGVGGALVVTGGVLLFFDLSSSPPPVSVGCAGSGCFATARGAF